MPSGSGGSAEIIGFHELRGNINTETENHSNQEVVIAELFHGPTMAFKVLLYCMYRDVFLMKNNYIVFACVRIHHLFSYDTGSCVEHRWRTLSVLPG